MITPLLKSALSPLVERHRRLRSLYASGMSWLLAGAVGAGFLLAHYSRTNAILATIGTLIIAILISRRWVGNWEPDYRAVARTIEDRHPELHALLRTAVEQKPDPQSGQLHYLQQRVVAEAVEATRRRQWFDSIPKSRWVGAYATRVLGFAAVLLTFAFLKPTPQRARVAVEKVATKDAVTVTPGDAELERGSGLVVLAKFHHDVPNEAILVLRPKNQPEQRLPLVKNLDDPVFGGGLPEVDADLSYRIEYAGQSTRDFSVKVFEHPRLERADATLDFPEYTKLPEKKIPDTHRVSAVEGTKLALDLQLNKAVKSATLVGKDGTKLPLAVQADKPVAELRDFPVKASQTYELQLVDADGRVNKIPAQFIVEALPNRRPELKIATPKGDSRVSPIEEVAFRAQAWDDFGLTRYGLSYTVAGGAAKDVSLGQETKADEKQQLAHLLKLEDIGAKPDELVSWYLWAEDTGPDGKPRRTETDMYFAEVRPFEEIFKQGDDGEEGEAKESQGNEAQMLAESQKQIISATWNIKRREEAAASPQPTEKYLKDTPVVRDSQGQILTKTKALGEKMENARSKALVENATKEMQAALDQLGEAVKTPEPLPRALTSEQSAYNALLKLAAHEFNVKKQKGKSGKEAKQGNQQQLDELELKEEKKRYETKREAESQQNEQQQEQLAILNRLKELAQRQNDINARVKELQTAMQEAKTEKEKEELRRQLKRLREEEQQVLADVDELRQKMEQSPQQSQLADERKQLDQTRTEAQKAAEAMEKNEASQALASGTRAAREMDQMRDDFRKKTSNQFRDEMRDMRADARDLAEKQQEIAEKLNGEAAKPERPTLDGNSERAQLGEQFEKQQGKLTKLTEDMKRVSEQAEAAEPLLAKELYDALRKTAQAGTGETLEKTQQLAQRGYQPQAQKFEEKARQEIEELKTGVEKAAESVLGDEAEALRQARAELDALTQQLGREIAQARPDLAHNDPGAKLPTPGGARDPRAGAGESPVPPSESAEADRTAKSTEAAPGDSPAAGRESRPAPGNSPRTAQDGKEPGLMAQNDGGKPGEQPGVESGKEDQPGKTSQTGSGKPSAPPGTQAGEGQKGKGQQPGKGGETAQNGDGKPGDLPGENGQGKQTGQGSQAKAGKGDQAAESGNGESSGSRDSTGNQDAPAGARPGARLADLAGAANQRAGTNNAGGGGGGGGGLDGGPLTGNNFVDWQDRLRNVEEMLDQPAMRNEAARVREIAKGVRAELKQRAAQPDWNFVDTKIRAPLAELRNRVTEELARRESKENLVPIDRDPVPTKYAERVRRYYEDLGRSN
ncbi:MAG: hypothetical protein WCF18_06205 [Chthoniobacteraceae bacterium]